MCCSQHEHRETLYNQGVFLGILNLSFRITVAFVLSLLEILKKTDKQNAIVSEAENTLWRLLDGFVTCTKFDCLRVYSKDRPFQDHVAATSSPQHHFGAIQ